MKSNSIIDYAAHGIALVVERAFENGLTQPRAMVVEDVIRIELAKMWIDAHELWSALEDEAAPFGEQQIHSFSLLIDRGHIERALTKLRARAEATVTP